MSNSFDVVARSKKTSDLIGGMKAKFIENARNSNAFFAEAIYAQNAVANNEKLASIAINNSASFKTAFLQLATTSLTLDPAQKLAYLVPRDGRVILDVSYLGLVKMAIEANMCRNLIVDLVFEKDDFKYQGRRTPPIHDYDPFADIGDIIIDLSDKGSIGERGNFRGVYVDYMLNDNSHLVFFITRRDISAARKKSVAWIYAKNPTSSWHTFPVQMIRKTAIKSSIHLLPNANQTIMRTIDYLNTAGGEGIANTNPIPLETTQYQMENAFSESADQLSTPVVVTQVSDESVVVNDIRDGVKRRIDNLVQRCAKNLTFETMLDEVSHNFEFNPSEVDYAKTQLLAKRQEVFQSMLTQGIKSSSFDDVNNLVNAMSEPEKSKYLSQVEQVISDLETCRNLFRLCKKQNDMQPLVTKLGEINFAPLSDYISSMIPQSIA